VSAVPDAEVVHFRRGGPTCPPNNINAGDLKWRQTPSSATTFLCGKAAMTYTKKLTKLSPLGQAMIFVVFLLMFIVRWFFFGSVLRSFNYDIILLPLAAIVVCVWLYARYRQRERHRLREEHIKVAAIIERARLEAGLLDEEPNKVNEYHLGDETNSLPQSG
ncbi:MAG TPA: hypothetical protein DEO84_05505, partial [candidate division Zixibacteria bacterium]|nr:hypothetical protein [candidate division Zixibacteria bacterium]